MADTKVRTSITLNPTVLQDAKDFIALEHTTHKNVSALIEAALEAFIYSDDTGEMSDATSDSVVSVVEVASA